MASGDENTEEMDRYLLGQQGYSIGKKIDSGTFGTVRYAEKHTSRGTMPLAVKVIDKGRTSPLFVSRFLSRELALWPRLHHRGVVQVQRVFQLRHRVYIFMELAPNGSVIDYIQRHGAPDESVACGWARRMAQALRYCHRKGVAHRDLKCDNLLLDDRMQIKVADFGFCCRQPLSDTYCGSSSYVAPEVLASQPYEPLPADVWSAGVCLYVMLNNAMPFDDANLPRMRDAQLARDWRWHPRRERNLPAAAKRLVTRMLEPDPALRPTMQQVLNSSWIKAR